MQEVIFYWWDATDHNTIRDATSHDTIGDGDIKMQVHSSS